MEEEEWAGLLLLSGVPSERLDWGGRRSGLLLLLLLLLVLLPSRATELERGGGRWVSLWFRASSLPWASTHFIISAEVSLLWSSLQPLLSFGGVQEGGGRGGGGEGDGGRNQEQVQERLRLLRKSLREQERLQRGGS